MKTKFIMIVAAISISALASAQQGYPRRTVEERVAAVHAKLDSAFHLDAAKQAKVDTVFAGYYRKQDQIRQELRSGGERPDFQAMREKLQPAVDARDTELKTLLSEQQFTMWKEQLEPSLAPQRQGRRQ